MHFSSPRDALGMGIATVYQDLAMIPLHGHFAQLFSFGANEGLGTISPFQREVRRPGDARGAGKNGYSGT